MTTILLARHGETDWNREGRWQGHSDPPLNAAGRVQARRLAERLASLPVAALYSSDLRRALETAELVASRLALIVRPRAALREQDLGSWSGLTLEEIERRFPDGFRRWRDTSVPGWEGGELPEEMAARVVSEVRALAAAHPGRQVLVVAHGGPIRAVQAEALGLDYATERRALPIVENCGLAAVAIRNGGFRPLDSVP